MGGKADSEEIAKNKRCYANTLRPCSRMLFIRRGVIIPWVNLSVTGNGTQLGKALLSPKPCTPMVTYAHGNFEQIASAIGMEVGQIAKHENRFEAAAYWYRLDRRRPTRIALSKTREKLDRIAKAARR